MKREENGNEFTFSSNDSDTSGSAISREREENGNEFTFSSNDSDTSGSAISHTNRFLSYGKRPLS